MGIRSHHRSTGRSARVAVAPRRRALTRLLGVLAVAGILVAGATLAPNSGLTAAATVPGTPGIPQAGTPVYTENFSNQNASLLPISILNYTGGAAAANSTYTASTQYTPAGNQCNGWVMSGTTPAAPITDLGCLNNVTSTWPVLQGMARALGVAQGQTTTQAATNQVLTSYTNSTTGTIAAGTQFRTVNTIPAIGGHYYAVSAYFAAVNCPAAAPSERFSLIVNGTPIVLSSGLNPCDPASPTPWQTQVAKLQSAAYMVPVGTTANLGLELYNATTTGSGNDVAFDLPQIVDVTPQLDKAFSPTLILNGTTSKMTLTVTNTTDLMAKNDWFITDALPANLRIAAVPNVGGTCASTAGAPYAVTAPAGGTSVGITGGDLALGQASCTITVDVTSTVNGTYINGPANITTNLNPPANASLEVIQPSIDLVKRITAVNGVAATSDTDPDKVFTKVGDVITYSFVATNTTPKAPTNTTLNTNLTNVQITEDTFSGAGDMTTLSCTPVQGSTLASGATMTCTATYVVQQADLDNAPLTNVARATGTPAVGPNVTDTDDEIIPAVWTPALLLDKTASVVDVDQDGVTGLGDHIMYAFDVTNTGNVTVANITVVDDRLTQRSITVTCTPTTIAPTQVAHCVANAPYVIDQADVDTKLVINTAYSTGTDPDNGPVRSNEDRTETPVEPFRIPLQIEKLGESDADAWVRMDGSSFAVLEDVAGEPGAALPFTIGDVETGLFQIDSIPAGTYWLSELTAPDGFSLLAAPVKFTINPDRTVSITAGGDEAVTAAGQTITVHDVPAMELPTTGGTGALPYILAGSLIVLGAGGFALWIRRRGARADTEDPQI
ncbi:SpaA isopeptide-forming pilin-related protein [Microbacterium sp. WCS2018Hpa-23]|uniref:prealbumin-like fold domain-containing protein n=1 Tax=Microbacterium sp. WCS2018Hpa-23 TaxID=3073634 RepID=UPI002883169F|nr:SpaA isopeptide-forming pilin-related protein [Microbacterium sp. WCS2018Hpa-23]